MTQCISIFPIFKQKSDHSQDLISDKNIEIAVFLFF